MDLATIMALRPVPAAGVLITMTRRCPLSCAHCSTASTLDAEQVDGGRLRRFVDSFTGDSAAPAVVMFTGGEPLLRPQLLSELACSARTAGVATAVLTGGFFARGGAIPNKIRESLLTLDHVSFSLDAFHEREVDRADVFSALAELIDLGQQVSLHLIGTGPADPYLAEVTAAVRQRFGSHAPMLVSELRAVGRAAAWATGRSAERADRRPLPCSLAAWPVLAFDGQVVACCNQAVVDARPIPSHLLLGDVAVDDWPAIRRRCLQSATLRLVRAVGPLHLIDRFDPDAADSPGGYCGACQLLAERPGVLAGAQRLAGGAVGELLDREVGLLQQRAGAPALLRRYASARYADLVAPS